MPQSLGRSNRMNANIHKNQWIKKSPISHGVYYPKPMQVAKNTRKIISDQKAVINKVSKNLHLKVSEKGKKFTDFYRVQ